jgi:hypothetical protein
MDYETLAPDKTRRRTFIYHATEKPKIVYSEDAQSWYEKEWADSPAKFFKLRDHDVDPENPMQVQQIGEAIEGVKDFLNGELNFDTMNKPELCEYAKKHFFANLNGGLSNVRRVEIIRDLIAGKTPEELGIPVFEREEVFLDEIPEPEKLS